MTPIIKHITSKKSVILLLILAFIVRSILIFLPAFKIDNDAWIAWSLRLHETGFANFYSPTYFSDYLPGYLYILYLLGFLPTLFSVSNEIFSIILKIIPSLAEVGLGLFVYCILNKYSSKKRLIAASFIWFNPGLLFNSTIWGQADSVLALSLLAAVYFLELKKPSFSAGTAALSFLIKPQTVLIAPLFILDLATHFSLKKILQLAIPSMLILIILSLPFFANPVTGLIEKTLSTANGYQYTSLFAFNIWGFIGMWQDDKLYYSLFTYQQWGTLLFVIFWIITAILFIKRKFSYYLLASLACLFFFFLPTRVHERYLYPAIPFLIISCFMIPNKSDLVQKTLLLSTFGLSIFYFFNLYYVYIYYNENFLHLPQILTYPPLYNVLDSNLKLLSFIQSTFFIIIVWTVFKYVYIKTPEKPHKE